MHPKTIGRLSWDNPKLLSVCFSMCSQLGLHSPVGAQRGQYGQSLLADVSGTGTCG